MRGEQRAEGLTLFPGGPDGPGSPVGPGDPWLGERTQHQKFVMSAHRAGLPQPRKHLGIQSFLWLALHGLSPIPCWWHSGTTTPSPQLLYLEQRLPGVCLLYLEVWFPPCHHLHLICRRTKPEPKAGGTGTGTCHNTSGSQSVPPAFHFHCCLSQIDDTSLCPSLGQRYSLNGL